MREEQSIGLPLTHTLTRDQTRNPGMCPDRESNLRPFALQDDTQPTVPQWSGQDMIFLKLQFRSTHINSILFLLANHCQPLKSF